MRNGLVGLLVVSIWGSPAGATQDPRPVFRSTVERVTVAATVRTRRGKPITNLRAADFELFDSGEARQIREFRTDSMPVSLALLVDFSGSMGVGLRRQAARDTAFHLVSSLAPGTDSAALFVFDQQLREMQPLAPAPGDIIAQLEKVQRPFGVTSLFDAIAEAGRSLAASGSPRRAVVALTDGADNASRMTPAEVSGLASSIDVPVYVVIVISPLDRSGRTTVDDPRLIDGNLQGPLADLARWTGGDVYVGVGPEQSSEAALQIVTDLRQQYLIAFEPGGRVGWHPIELRTRDKDLVVRARSGYMVQGNRVGS
jgi:Ca-activated chloride channel family protein